MKKTALIVGFGCLMAFNSFAFFNDPASLLPKIPRITPNKSGILTLDMNNATSVDLLLDATCRKNAGDAIPLPSKGNASLNLKFDGSSGCKVIVVVRDYPDQQAVMCLDKNACEHNCDPNDPDCAGGNCDNIGIAWVRGGNYMLNKQDICVRGSAADPNDPNALVYGVAPKKSFCAYFLNDPYRLSQARDNRVNANIMKILKTMCVGASANGGYVWNNPPNYQVKCSKGAVFSGTGCTCPPNKKLKKVYNGTLGNGVVQDAYECE